MVVRILGVYYSRPFIIHRSPLNASNAENLLLGRIGEDRDEEQQHYDVAEEVLELLKVQ